MRRLAACIAVTGVGFLAACGGSEQDTTAAPAATEGGSSSTCSADVTVANLAVSNAAAVVLGVEEGFFEEEGLNVTLKDTAAASTQPAVVSGEAQFAFTNVPAVLAASSNGLPVRVVAPTAAYPDPSEPATIAVLAGPDSGITEPQDLEGKKIAVDTLYQLPHLSMILAARAAGVDDSTFEISEIPYPAMAEAVERGQVDAADMGDPFLSQSLAKGFVEVLGNNEGFDQGRVQALWVTSADYAEENPDVVACFQRAVAKSNEYAEENPDAARQILPTYTQVPEQLAANLRMPSFDVDIDREQFETYLELMKEVDVVKKDVDLDTVILEQNGG